MDSSQVFKVTSFTELYRIESTVPFFICWNSDTIDNYTYFTGVTMMITTVDTLLIDLQKKGGIFDNAVYYLVSKRLGKNNSMLRVKHL